MDVVKRLKPITSASSGSSNTMVTTHPAFGVATVSKEKTPEGFGVFQCKNGEEEIVVLRVSNANVMRRITGDSVVAQDDMIELVFSKAQWGALLSGDSNVPCTISCVDGVFVPRISKITISEADQ